MGSVWHGKVVWACQLKPGQALSVTVVHCFQLLQGPRACVGSRLAMVEARVLLGRLLSQFRFVLPPGAERSPTGLSEVVLRPESCELQVLPL